MMRIVFVALICFGFCNSLTTVATYFRLSLNRACGHKVTSEQTLSQVYTCATSICCAHKCHFKRSSCNMFSVLKHDANVTCNLCQRENAVVYDMDHSILYMISKEQKESEVTTAAASVTKGDAAFEDLIRRVDRA
ncbi:Uncharacterised protein g8371 [Pycnogonum litorale]